jgi:hypothetical protein
MEVVAGQFVIDGLTRHLSQGYQLIHNGALEVIWCPGIAAQCLLQEGVFWQYINIFEVVVLHGDDDVTNVVYQLESMEDGGGRALVENQEIFQQRVGFEAVQLGPQVQL